MSGISVWDSKRKGAEARLASAKSKEYRSDSATELREVERQKKLMEAQEFLSKKGQEKRSAEREADTQEDITKGKVFKNTGEFMETEGFAKKLDADQANMINMSVFSLGESDAAVLTQSLQPVVEAMNAGNNAAAEASYNSLVAKWTKDGGEMPPGFDMSTGFKGNRNAVGLAHAAGVNNLTQLRAERLKAIAPPSSTAASKGGLKTEPYLMSVPGEKIPYLMYKGEGEGEESFALVNGQKITASQLQARGGIPMDRETLYTGMTAGVASATAEANSKNKLRVRLLNNLGTMRKKLLENPNISAAGKASQLLATAEGIKITLGGVYTSVLNNDGIVPTPPKGIRSTFLNPEAAKDKARVEALFWGLSAMHAQASKGVDRITTANIKASQNFLFATDNLSALSNSPDSLVAAIDVSSKIISQMTVDSYENAEAVRAGTLWDPRPELIMANDILSGRAGGSSDGYGAYEPPPGTVITLDVALRLAARRGVEGEKGSRGTVKIPKGRGSDEYDTYTLKQEGE